MTPVESVATTFGIDIMQDNVDECHGRIINLLDERGESYDLDEIKEILRTRIVVNNALENTMENIFMEVI